MKFFLEEFKPVFNLSDLQTKVLIYIILETYDENLFNTLNKSDLLYFNTWYVVTREYEFIPIWLDRIPLRRIMIYYFIRLMYLLYGTLDTSINIDLTETSDLKDVNSNSIEDVLFLSLSDKIFFLSSFMLLFISVLFYILKGRSGFMKFLFSLELLILIGILGFTLYHSGVCYLAGQFNLAICLIALAACESVLGLALYITRKRIQSTTITSNFIKYFTFKSKIN